MRSKHPLYSNDYINALNERRATRFAMWVGIGCFIAAILLTCVVNIG